MIPSKADRRRDCRATNQAAATAATLLVGLVVYWDVLHLLGFRAPLGLVAAASARTTTLASSALLLVVLHVAVRLGRSFVLLGRGLGGFRVLLVLGAATPATAPVRSPPSNPTRRWCSATA